MLSRGLVVFALVVAVSLPAWADPAGAKHVTESDIPYRAGDGLTDAMRQRCTLDVHYPEGGRAVPAVVWFHGGGLVGLDKSWLQAHQVDADAVAGRARALPPKQRP
jgi:acetyl esterase/lipase